MSDHLSITKPFKIHGVSTAALETWNVYLQYCLTAEGRAF